VTFFISGVLIVGGGTWLSWRWIAQPVAQLSRAARALGSGDLKTRVGLARTDELGELGGSFDDMAERIERLVLAQKELLANVSHELRTPLARIRVALDIAGEGDASVARASLEEIAVDLGELEGMIEDILAALRLDLQTGAHRAQSFALRPETVQPEDIVEQARRRFAVRHPERALDVQLGPELAPIRVDVTLFRRVLDNLLENAQKYSSADDPIVLAVRRSADEVMFEVTDRGLGISEEDLPRIFEPFFRAERSRSRGLGGVGLGLTLAKSILDAHGARIELTSSAGRTRATVSIRRAA